MTTEPTVYLVDEDPDFRKYLQVLLSSVGYKVKTYATGNLFYTDYLPGKSGCLVLDIQLPNLSGFEIFKQLERRGIRLPVIVVSGKADVSMSVRVMKEGVIDFLEKPFNDESILKSIREALHADSELRKIQQQHSKIATCLAHLSIDELQVLELLCHGASNREMASRLNLGIKILEAHRAKLMKKMEARSLADLIKMALVARIIS